VRLMPLDVPGQNHYDPRSVTGQGCPKRLLRQGSEQWQEGSLFPGAPVTGFFVAVEYGNGPCAHFFVCGEMQKSSKAIRDLVRGVVEPMGYELVGVEYLTGQPGGNLLRVYIDKEEGITLDDCSAVSHQLSGVLDVEDPIPGNYNLEVSSPGLDRPLFEPEHFERFAGKKVNIRLDASIPGRRRYKGTLLGIEEDRVQVEVDGEVFSLDLDEIRDARLVPEI